MIPIVIPFFLEKNKWACPFIREVRVLEKLKVWWKKIPKKLSEHAIFDDEIITFYY